MREGVRTRKGGSSVTRAMDDCSHKANPVGLGQVAQEGEQVFRRECEVLVHLASIQHMPTYLPSFVYDALQEVLWEDDNFCLFGSSTFDEVDDIHKVLI